MTEQPSVDTLGNRAVVGVMTPGMNTVVQPELEALRPAGVTNQMQRFTLGGDRVSEDLVEQAAVLMAAGPTVLAIGLTSDAGPGGVTRLARRCEDLAEAVGIPVCNASAAAHAGLRALGAERIGVLTPFAPDVDAVVRDNFTEAGFDVVAIGGTCAPSLPAICATPLDEIRAVFARVATEAAAGGATALCQVGTALPVVDLLDELEAATGLPVVACNAAVYWQALRTIGIDDPVPGFGTLLRDH